MQTLRRRGARQDALSILAREHAALLVVLTAGVLLRLAVALAYRPALLSVDSWGYLDVALRADPVGFAPERPSGYPLLLNVLLLPGRSLAVVTTVQHLAGLAGGVLTYALLLRLGAAAARDRRGLRVWKPASHLGQAERARVGLASRIAAARAPGVAAQHHEQDRETRGGRPESTPAPRQVHEPDRHREEARRPQRDGQPEKQAARGEARRSPRRDRQGGRLKQRRPKSASVSRCCSSVTAYASAASRPARRCSATRRPGRIDEPVEAKPDADDDVGQKSSQQPALTSSTTRSSPICSPRPGEDRAFFERLLGQREGDDAA